jgi:lysophospholipase L1-like esterase
MKRTLEIALLVFVPLALFLLIGEITLRAYLGRHTFYNVEMSRYAQLLKVDSPNPLIGHVHRPNGRATLMNVEIRTNSDGFRDDEYALERNHRQRILFLGDSLTLGWGVEKEDTFEALLEQRLTERTPTEVINFGAGNYNTTQEVNLFLDKGLAYRPDRVVLFYFINDAEPVPQPSRFEWLGNVRLFTFYWSRVKALMARFSPEAGFQGFYSALYGEEQPGWRQTRDSFLKLRDACREHGIGLQVVILPELHDLVDYTFAREHTLVADFLTQHGIPVLDLAPSFRSVTEPQGLWVALDDAHPNARAHSMIAQHSLEFLSGAER